MGRLSWSRHKKRNWRRHCQHFFQKLHSTHEFSPQLACSYSINRTLAFPSSVLMMLLWTLCSLLVFSGAECLEGATDAACDAVGLIQSRVQQKKPKVYVYELPSRFQNQSKAFPPWHDSSNQLRPEQWTSDLVFEGPPDNVEGYPVWTHDGNRVPIMLHYRLLKSHQRTLDVDEADVFFIPAYQFQYPRVNCNGKDDLIHTLIKLNPKLKDQAWVREKGPRHLLASGRMEFCDYMYDDELLGSAVRVSKEISQLDSNNRWAQDLPWRWY